MNCELNYSIRYIKRWQRINFFLKNLFTSKKNPSYNIYFSFQFSQVFCYPSSIVWSLCQTQGSSLRLEYCLRSMCRQNFIYQCWCKWTDSRYFSWKTFSLWCIDKDCHFRIRSNHGRIQHCTTFNWSPGWWLWCFRQCHLKWHTWRISLHGNFTEKIK